MQIASITMIGQFPDGIDLHVRSLKRIFNATDYHIYIITSLEALEKINIKDDRLTFITKPTPKGEFTTHPQTGFVNFCMCLPAILKPDKISPAWILSMQRDVGYL